MGGVGIDRTENWYIMDSIVREIMWLLDGADQTMRVYREKKGDCLGKVGV